MKRILFLLATVALLCGGGMANGQESVGVRLFKTTREKAEQGDAKAQNLLGVLYYNGNGVPKNYVEAVKWYRKAAEQGNAKAQLNLGWMYRYGRGGVRKDSVESYAWFRLAKAKGIEESSKAISQKWT